MVGKLSTAEAALTVDATFRARLAATPNEPFIDCGSGWVTFAELDERADRLATGLADLGVERGDRVATILPNGIEAVDMLFAVARLGAIQVPFNYYLKGEWLNYQLRDCAAEVLVCDRPGYDAASRFGVIDPGHSVIIDDPADGTLSYDEITSTRKVFGPPETGPSDLVAIMYTSGTTAAAKGCMLSNGYYVNVGRAYSTDSWLVAGDRMYTGFPLFHTSGQKVALMTALVNDASIVIAREFHASTFMRDAAKAGATMLVGVGSMAQLILAQPERPEDGDHPFRLAWWVPLAPEKQEEFERRFNTPALAEGYGQTECVPISVTGPDGSRRRDSAGRISPLLEARIVDEDDNEVLAGGEGEIVVRPKVPHAMYSGYWNKPEITVETWSNLWHHTGDFGRFDEDGVLYFVDRKKDIVRRRGENVSCLALEGVIRQHPAVSNVAVVPIPSEMGEDEVMACVVLEEGATIDPEAFFEWIRPEVAYFAVPRYLRTRDELPANALGRIMKHVIREEGTGEGVWDLQELGLVVERNDRRTP